jgi:hypothetical protein
MAFLQGSLGEGWPGEISKCEPGELESLADARARQDLERTEVERKLELSLGSTLGNHLR